jgi:hypothetical protein
MVKVLKDDYKLDLNVRNKIEEILYALPALIDFVEDNMCEGGAQRKSKDIVVWMNSERSEHTSEYEIENESLSRAERTYEKVAKIQRILDKMEEMDVKRFGTRNYFSIIEKTYFDRTPFSEICRELNICQDTYYVHKNRLLHTIAVRLYGIDVLLFGGGFDVSEI